MDKFSTTFQPVQYIRKEHEIPESMKEYYEDDMTPFSLTPEVVESFSDLQKVEVPGLSLVVHINDMKFDNLHESLGLWDLIFNAMDSTTWYDEGKDKTDRSSFYLFTCSCGEAGCAGIFNGILVKVRKNTVEWRINDEKTIEILGKRFFSFPRKEYEEATIGIAKRLLDSEKKVGRKLIIDVDNHGYEAETSSIQDYLDIRQRRLAGYL